MSCRRRSPRTVPGIRGPSPPSVVAIPVFEWPSAWWFRPGSRQNAAQRRSRICRAQARDRAHPCSQRRRAVTGPQDPAPEIQRSSIQQTARTGAHELVDVARDEGQSGRSGIRGAVRHRNRAFCSPTRTRSSSPGRPLVRSARAPLPGRARAPRPQASASSRAASAVPPHLTIRRPAARRGATTSPPSPKKPPGVSEADRDPPATARRP